MIPPRVYELCRNGKSVSAELARNPTESPSKAAKALFGSNIEEEVQEEKETTLKQGSDDLEQALACGNFGDVRPSDLFLRASL